MIREERLHGQWLRKNIGVGHCFCNGQQSAICRTKTPNDRSILFCADIVTDQIESVSIFLIFLKKLFSSQDISIQMIN